jgi:hypothetical protein
VDVGRLNDLISGGKVCVPFLIIECKDNWRLVCRLKRSMRLKRTRMTICRGP